MVAYAGLSDYVTFVVGPFADTYHQLRELGVDRIDVCSPSLNIHTNLTQRADTIALVSVSRTGHLHRSSSSTLSAGPQARGGRWMAPTGKLAHSAPSCPLRHHHMVVAFVRDLRLSPTILAASRTSDIWSTCATTRNSSPRRMTRSSSTAIPSKTVWKSPPALLREGYLRS